MIYPNGDKETKTYFSLELAENGELFDYIAYTGPLDEKTSRFYFR